MAKNNKKGIYTKYDGLTQPLRNRPDYGRDEGSSVGDRLERIHDKMDKQKRKSNMSQLGIARELVKLATEFGEAEPGSLLSQLNELHDIDMHKHKSATEENGMNKETRELMASIRSLKKRLLSEELGREAVEDAGIDSWADELANAERSIAQESTGISVDDEGDQNAKSMKNWPLTASERQMLASRLVKLAKSIIED